MQLWHLIPSQLEEFNFPEVYFQLDRGWLYVGWSMNNEHILKKNILFIGTSYLKSCQFSFIHKKCVKDCLHV